MKISCSSVQRSSVRFCRRNGWRLYPNLREKVSDAISLSRTIYAMESARSQFLHGIVRPVMSAGVRIPFSSGIRSMVVCIHITQAAICCRFGVAFVLSLRTQK